MLQIWQPVLINVYAFKEKIGNWRKSLRKSRRARPYIQKKKNNDFFIPMSYSHKKKCFFFNPTSWCLTEDGEIYIYFTPPPPFNKTPDFFCNWEKFWPHDYRDPPTTHLKYLLLKFAVNRSKYYWHFFVIFFIG